MTTDVSQELQDLKARQDDLEDLLLQVAAAQQKIAEQVTQGGPGSSTGGAGKNSAKALLVAADIDWRALDANGARAAWDRLIAWSEWLVETFPIAAVLPSCWAQHPALVWDLSAMHLAFVGAYEDPDAGRTAPLVWIEQLHRATMRWRDWDNASCGSKGRHVTDFRPFVWPAGWQSDAARHTAVDVAARPATSEPGPAQQPPSVGEELF